MYSILTTFCVFSLAIAPPFAPVGQSAAGREETFPRHDVTVGLRSPCGAYSQDTSKTEGIPPSDEFVPVEVEPTFDEADLYGKLKYPPEAMRNNIEGKVVIRVYVDTAGVVRKSYFEESTDKMFEQTVLDAAATTRFTPASIGGKRVGVWISIPISFKLRDPEPKEEKEEGK